MLSEARYVDTREQAPGLFAAPAGCADYRAWLEQRYAAAVFPATRGQVCIGIAQATHRLIAEALDGIPLLALGPHAGAAAAFIEEISGGRVTVEVLA